MARRSIVAFAVFASCILVTAAPVTASHGEFAVGSSHSTESELASGTVSDLSITGSGQEASLVLPRPQSDAFEDSTLTGWTQLQGTWSESGGYLRSDSGDQDIQWTGGGEVGPGFSATVELQPDYNTPNSSANPGVSFLSQNASNFYGVRFLDNETIALQQRVKGTYSLVDSVSGPFDMTHWYTIEIKYVSGETTVTVTDQTTGDSWILSHTFDPQSDFGKISGYLGAYSYAGAAADSRWENYSVNTEVDSWYVSENHTVTSARKAWANFTLSNATATVRVLTWNSSAAQWQVVNSSQFSSTGNYTLDVSGSFEKWRINATFNKTGSNPTAELHDEGILVETSAPTADEANATPANGNGTTGRDVTFEIPVNDTDFGRSQGDSVDATLVLDGTGEGTTTLTSNGTASVTVTGVSGGDHSYHWELTDDYGHTTTTKTSSFQAPMKLTIHKGSNLSQLVTKSVEVEIYATSDKSSFYATKTVSDGTVVFGDMPDEQLKIELNATNYSARKMIINHPYSKTDRHTVLYDSRDSETFTQCFSLDSQGAGFSPTDTWLIMQVFVDGKWRDAAGGYFQAPNKRCIVQQDSDEYRLVIEDLGGDRRGLGGYTADIGFRDRVIPLTVEGVTLSLDRGDLYSWSVEAHNGTPDQVAGAGNITYKFKSGATTAKDLHVVIYEKDNRSNVLDEMTVSGTVESYQTSFVLEEDQIHTSWVVEWNATADGRAINGSDVVVAAHKDVSLGTSPMWTKVAVGIFFLVISGVFGAIHAPIGGVVAAGSAALLHTAGLYHAPATTIYFALSVAIVGYAAANAGGGR